MKKVFLSLFFMVILFMFFNDQTTLAVTSELSNTQLMLETGVTVGDYNSPGSNLYTVRFRDAEETGKWLYSLYFSQILVEGLGIIEKDSLIEKLLKSKPLKPHVNYIIESGPIALFEKDNGYDLIDSSLWLPLKNQLEKLPENLIIKLDSEILKMTNNNDLDLILKLITGRLPEIGVELTKYLDVDYEKSAEVRDILVFLLRDAACPDYIWENGVYSCDGNNFGRTAIYGNGIYGDMGYISLTDFNTKDVQFKSNHYFPRVDSQKSPSFTAENLRYFIYDSYQLLAGKQATTPLKNYVTEVFEAYKFEKTYRSYATKLNQNYNSKIKTKFYLDNKVLPVGQTIGFYYDDQKIMKKLVPLVFIIKYSRDDWEKYDLSSQKGPHQRIIKEDDWVYVWDLPGEHPYEPYGTDQPEAKEYLKIYEEFYAILEEKESNGRNETLEWPLEKHVGSHHNWTIKFNDLVNEKTVNNKNYYILHKGKQITDIKVSLNADGKSVNIQAPKEGYKIGETYTLHISDSVQSATNKYLYQSIKMDFTIGVLTEEELAKARYKTVIKDEKGFDYNIYMMPKEENYINGIYRGNYGFVLQKVESDQAIWQEEEIKNLSYNVGMVSVINGKPKANLDLLVLTEKVSNYDKALRLYAIHEGQLINLKIVEATSNYSILAASNPKFINTNTIQNVTYSNQKNNIGWEYENYQIDLTHGLLIKKGQSIIYKNEDIEKGKEVYERWVKEPDYILQAEPLPVVKWEGEWKRELPFHDGILQINHVQSSTFDFTLHVTSGTSIDFMEGKADFVGNKATFSDPDSNCILTFTHNEESISIDQSMDCIRIATFFSGEFELNPVLVENSLYPFVIDSQMVNEKFRELTKTDYQLFYESMQLVSRDGYDNEVKGKVIRGVVRGLFTFMEAVIVIGDDGHLYGAVISDQTIHYYTSNPKYNNRLPQSITDWMEDFNHYKVEYLS